MKISRIYGDAGKLNVAMNPGLLRLSTNWEE